MVEAKPGLGRSPEPSKAPVPMKAPERPDALKGDAKDVEQEATATKSDASLFDRAKAKAPSLTTEFVAQHKLSDEYLEDVAAGFEPPPPYIPENDFTELHREGGSWSITAKGAK